MLLKATNAQRPDLPQPTKISSNDSKLVKTKLSLYRVLIQGFNWTLLRQQKFSNDNYLSKFLIKFHLSVINRHCSLFGRQKLFDTRWVCVSSNQQQWQILFSNFDQGLNILGLSRIAYPRSSGWTPAVPSVIVSVFKMIEIRLGKELIPNNRGICKLLCLEKVYFFEDIIHRRTRRTGPLIHGLYPCP